MTHKIIPYKAKVVRNGNSLHIRVPAFLKDLDMEIEKGDIVQVELKVIKKKSDEKIKRPLPDQDLRPIKFQSEVE